MGCDALLLLRWPGSQIAFRLALLARPLHLVCQINRSRNVSPAFYYHSRCWWRWRSNVMSFMHTFPWDYSTNNILFPFCYAGSRSSTVSHQLRTNQRDPSYPPTAAANDVLIKWYSPLDNTSLPSLSQYKKQSFIHSFNHLDAPIPFQTYVPIYSSLLPHASHFLVMIGVAHSSISYTYTSGSVYLFLSAANLL